MAVFSVFRHPKRAAKKWICPNGPLMFRISFSVFLACASAASIAQSTENLDLTIRRIAKVEVFAFGGVGFAGVISPGEKDYQLILSRPSAEADFEKLLVIGNPQAQCYALVGLRQLNPEKFFKALAASQRSSQAEVSTMHGCLMWHETMTAIVERIQAGGYVR